MARLCLDDIDGAIFDLDGVVTDTASLHAAAWKQALDAVLATLAPSQPRFDAERDYRRFVDGRPRLDGAASFLASRGIDLPLDGPDQRSVTSVAERKDALFVELLGTHGPGVFGSTVALVRRLRAAGLPVAVVTASRHGRDVLRLAGLEHAFDVVLDGVVAEQRHLAGKPDPSTFQAAAEQLGVTPARAAVFEDAVAGIVAARAGGFGVIVGLGRERAGSGLRDAGAHVVVDDLAHVAVTDRSGWTITDGERSSARERAYDAVFTCADGHVAVRGDTESDVPSRRWLTLVGGAYGRASDGLVRLLPGPVLAPVGAPRGPVRRALELRTGVLRAEGLDEATPTTSMRFVSVARPGVVVVRVDGPSGTRWSDTVLAQPRLGASAALACEFDYRSGSDGGTCWAETRSDRATVRAAACDIRSESGAGASVVRIMVVSERDTEDELRRRLDAACEAGFDLLLAEQREAWSSRWAAADIEIDGDEGSQEAVRLAIYHLLSAAPTCGEAAVGARGLTGFAYSGHVFWDADVFVLPALAATLPAAARAMLEYRLRRLPAARRRAAAEGRPGARFPWESADAGDDVTPPSVRDVRGRTVPIRTGGHEIHVNAAVAWSARQYLRWTGDAADACEVLGVETARWWASRVEHDPDGSAHLRRVMGPDEYHEVVDDNAYTNGVAAWNLRAGARALVDDPATAASWIATADALVDGFRPELGIHEQFAGFLDLEPLRIAELAPVPVAADILLGPDRVARAQVIKQPDVLMLHHLLPDESRPASLRHDLDFYLPRTAHGSSLSPGICASLLARDGRADDALALFDLTCRLDLDDITNSTAAGVHLGALGTIWQAAVFGFAGVTLRDDALHVDPHLPGRWSSLRLHLQLRGTGVVVEVTPGTVTIVAQQPTVVVVGTARASTPAHFVKGASGWRLLA